VECTTALFGCSTSLRGNDCGGDDGGCSYSNSNSDGSSRGLAVMKTTAATVMVGGTDSNSLHEAVEETMAAETATAIEMAMVTVTITMSTPMLMTAH
jgi:hypothetical protein